MEKTHVKDWTEDHAAYGRCHDSVCREFALQSVGGYAADSHRQIIDAIASGDSERASRVAREHQENFERLPTPNARLQKE
jgi:DNA-binding GntR family transcriptional regulator